MAHAPRAACPDNARTRCISVTQRYTFSENLMQKIVTASTLALSLFAASSVHADDTPRYYVGAATGFSKATLENSVGERFSSKKHPLPVKLYAGVELTDYLALEAGYSGSTGQHAFDKGLFGTSTEPRLASQAIYLAAKGTVAVSESIDLHAKLGVARNHFKLSDAGIHNRDIRGTRPMLGIGAAYKLTENAAVTLEFESYGTVREQQTSLRQQRLQAGLKFGF